MSITTLNRDRILEVTARIGHLPALPRVAVQVEQELSLPKASAARIAELVKMDPALCAAILRHANSAIHAPRREIADITQAIAHIGFEEVRRIVMVASLIGTWPRLSLPDLHRFWTHSVAVGLTTVELSRTLRSPLDCELRDATFIAGLLHDLGALVLFGVFPDECLELRQLAEARGCPIAEIEIEQWAIDHGGVADVLADRWNLPIVLRQSMVHHHQPWLATAPERRLVQVVHVADFFCNNQGFGRSNVGLPPWFDEDAWEALGFELSDVLALVDRVTKQCSDSQVWVNSIQMPCR